ncbi:hypothetical protein ACH427_11700 [Streptomyces sp. NPDC020379]|uniref:hypothetical protein n=1 Tax=Streptomyces sp. NPDC020379 TaxID=3365071 RepID=UPI0037898C08
MDDTDLRLAGLRRAHSRLERATVDARALDHRLRLLGHRPGLLRWVLLAIAVWCAARGGWALLGA